MSKETEIIAKLNMMLKQEHACMIRYATHAAVVTGAASESIKARLKEISKDEAEHAEKLRDRILALGGKPTMEIHLDDLKEAYDLPTIIKINMHEEVDAIKMYTEILEMVPETNVILYRTIQDIIQDEQDHLEQISALLSSP